MYLYSHSYKLLIDNFLIKPHINFESKRDITENCVIIIAITFKIYETLMQRTTNCNVNITL